MWEQRCRKLFTINNQDTILWSDSKDWGTCAPSSSPGFFAYGEYKVGQLFPYAIINQ